jgi:hypothetical protein
MDKNQPFQTVTVKFDRDEFRNLTQIADKFNISVEETIRCLIPRITSAKDTSAPPAQSGESLFQEKGPLSIKDDLDLARLSEICGELSSSGNMGKQLGDEIRKQVIDSKRNFLTMTTEKRLIAWCHPKRKDRRTEFATPRAREISMILFAYVPDRHE